MLLLQSRRVARRRRRRCDACVRRGRSVGRWVGGHVDCQGRGGEVDEVKSRPRPRRLRGQGRGGTDERAAALRSA